MIYTRGREDRKTKYKKEPTKNFCLFVLHGCEIKWAANPKSQKCEVIYLCRLRENKKGIP